jgi:hypothetical protein
VVDVRGAPVIIAIIAIIRGILVPQRRKIMQQPRLSSRGRPDNMFQVPLPIPVNILSRIAIARSCHKRCSIDHKPAQPFGRGSETGEASVGGLAGPYVRRRIFGEVGIGALGAGEGGILGLGWY